MRLKPEFVTYELDGDQFMVSAVGGFGAMLRSNETAAFIVDCLAEETTEQAIVEAMVARYDAPPEQIAADVHRVIAQLQEIGVLEGAADAP